MRVLIVGATGQIGHALTRALSQTSHPTSILLRDRHKLVFPENTNVFESQVFTTDAFARALGAVDCVIYALGMPEQFSFDAQIFQQLNYDLCNTFLQGLKASKVRHLVYISTYEVFQARGGIIRETQSIADPSTMTPYYKAMTQAYQLVLDFAVTNNVALTTIHPAAVYGGINTGTGFTNYIENLLTWRIWRVPVIIEGMFPVVNVESLAGAIIASLTKPGTYLVSDQMTSLQEIALLLREQTKSYVPPTVSFATARAATTFLEFFAKRLGVRPIMAQVQLDFIAKGLEPRSDRAQAELGCQPLSLRQGLQQYLKDRDSLLRVLH